MEVAIVAAAVLVINVDFQTLRKGTIYFSYFHYSLGLYRVDTDYMSC